MHTKYRGVVIIGVNLREMVIVQGSGIRDQGIADKLRECAFCQDLGALTMGGTEAANAKGVRSDLCMLTSPCQAGD